MPYFSEFRMARPESSTGVVRLSPTPVDDSGRATRAPDIREVISDIPHISHNYWIVISYIIYDMNIN